MLSERFADKTSQIIHLTTQRISDGESEKRSCEQTCIISNIVTEKDYDEVECIDWARWNAQPVKLVFDTLDEATKIYLFVMTPVSMEWADVRLNLKCKWIRQRL